MLTQGQQVWITSAPGIPHNIVGATGVVRGIAGSGRAQVIFHPDDEIRRRLNASAIYVVTSALTTTNPFAK